MDLWHAIYPGWLTTRGPQSIIQLTTNFIAFHIIPQDTANSCLPCSCGILLQPSLHVSVQTATAKLNENESNYLRMRVCGVLSKAMPLVHNLSRQQRITLKELKQIAILPADKGNATVLMTRDEYNIKLENLLNTDMYIRLKKDPTHAQEARISRILRDT